MNLYIVFLLDKIMSTFKIMTNNFLSYDEHKILE